MKHKRCVRGGIDEVSTPSLIIADIAWFPSRHSAWLGRGESRGATLLSLLLEDSLVLASSATPFAEAFRECVANSLLRGALGVCTDLARSPGGGRFS